MFDGVPCDYRYDGAAGDAAAAVAWLKART